MISPLELCIKQLLALLSCVLLSLNAQGELIVVHPQAESLADERPHYPLELLRLCEKKSNHKFRLQQYHAQTLQGRSLQLLTYKKGIDVVWALTTEEREKNFRAIRIPIDKGLIGWRLLLIRQADINKFEHIHRVEDLAALRTVQGHDWPDIDILKENRLQVTALSNYEGMFKMLALNRVDYIPRSISEIWQEQENHKHLSIEIEKTLLLHYRAAIYFFVKKDNKKLADILEACLIEAHQDGSFNDIFERNYREIINRTMLDKRRLILLKNSLLPADTPIDKLEYWFSPQNL